MHDYLRKPLTHTWLFRISDSVLGIAFRQMPYFGVILFHISCNIAMWSWIQSLSLGVRESFGLGCTVDEGFPGGIVVKDLLAMQETPEMQFQSLSGKIPTGGGPGDPLQCSCLGSPMDRGAWWAAVSGRKDSDMTEHAHIVTKGFNSRFSASSGYIICQDRRGCRSERSICQTSLEMYLLNRPHH